MNNKKLFYKFFIGCFILLYLMVAFVSFIHAIEFFNIGNEKWMSIILAGSFEVGLAMCLLSILVNEKSKSNTAAWITMIVLVTVQVIGNVFSVFKHMALSPVDYYVYLQKPLLFWIEEVSQETIMIIIAWITGAILPVVALLMTDMVASNIKYLDDQPVPEEKPQETPETETPTKAPENVEYIVKPDTDAGKINIEEVKHPDPVETSDEIKVVEAKPDIKKKLIGGLATLGVPTKKKKELNDKGFGQPI